ncbi:MAG: RNA 2',3'-cyclic phosphodiesterase [Spirochaetes bacterium]|nr:MAG: RNA 2',3'-cyclic phosphodiesterase [Spirochaetota bacterium]
MRTFLAVTIPLEIKNKIEKFIEEFKYETDKKRSNVKWVKIENIHITIYFFGNVGNQDLSILSNKLPEIGNTYPPFEISIKGVSAFPKPESPRVIWCGIIDNSNTLRKTNGFVRDIIRDNNLNVDIDNREFSPHLTIGRVKGRYCDSLVKKIISSELREFGSFIINELVLFSSTLTKYGPIYNEIERYSFGRKG